MKSEMARVEDSDGPGDSLSDKVMNIRKAVGSANKISQRYCKWRLTSDRDRTSSDPRSIPGSHSINNGDVQHFDPFNGSIGAHIISSTPAYRSYFLVQRTVSTNLMRRYILFGSRNEIAQSFIRLARSRNHRILCLHPYKTPGPNYINYNFLLTSLGGIPLRYSFRDEFTGEHGYHQIKALVSMLKGVDGVVWAAHPLRGETTWSEKREERVKEYMEDLRSLLAVMKIGKKRTFVCLSIAPQRHEAEGKVMGENEGIMTQEAQELEKLEENMVDLMSRMKTLDWTVVRVSYPENELEDLHADGSGKGHIPGEGRQRYIEWVNDVAKTVMDTLEYGISKRIVEVNSKSAYNEEEFRIENVEALPALEHASQATSVIQSTHCTSPANCH